MVSGAAGIKVHYVTHKKERFPSSASYMVIVLGALSFFSRHCFPVGATTNCAPSRNDFLRSVIVLASKGGAGVTL